MLLWNNEINMRVLGFSDHFIDSKIGAIGDDFHWRFIGFYGHSAMEDCPLS